MMHGIKAACSATKLIAPGVQDVAIWVKEGEINFKTISHDGWIMDPDCDRIFYASRPMTMREIENRLG